MTYIEVKDQCWFKRCRRLAEHNAIIHGKKVIICSQHYRSVGQTPKEQRS